MQKSTEFYIASGSKETNELMNMRTWEDKCVLAFRKYTQAVITYDLFVKKDEASRLRHLHDDEQRLDFLQQFEQIGLEALELLESSLNEWPVS